MMITFKGCFYDFVYINDEFFYHIIKIVLDHIVIDANGLIIWEIVGSYVIDVNGLIDWCEVIDWLMIDEECICIFLDENDRCQSGNQLIKMDHWYDA